MTTIEQLNAEITAAHDAHYKNAPEGWDGLVDLRDPHKSPETSPNGNTIYHLYSTGEISYQKGAWAYLDRSEFTYDRDFMSQHSLEYFPFKFPKQARGNITYAILTIEEAKNFRQQMLEIYNQR